MKIGLFIPCYVDAIFPEVGVATYKLLTHLGLDVTYPVKQTCCGQPMANAGFQDKALPLAEKFETLFKNFDYIVAPSVSCTAFVRFNYPALLKGKHECITAQKAMDVVELRELGLSSPSEQNITPFNKMIDLLHLVHGVEVVEPERKDECCGFGGMFSVEETAVSAQMGKDKVEQHIATGAEYITGPDCSCLMHMEGVAKRQHLPIKFIHIVQIFSAGL